MQYRYRLIVPDDHAERARYLIRVVTERDPDEPPPYNDATIFDVYTSEAGGPLARLLMRRRVDKRLRHVAEQVKGNLTRMPLHTVYQPEVPSVAVWEKPTGEK